MWILVLEGLLIGCLLGLTGAGGGILAVPANDQSGMECRASRTDRLTCGHLISVHWYATGAYKADRPL